MIIWPSHWFFTSQVQDNHGEANGRDSWNPARRRWTYRVELPPTSRLPTLTVGVRSWWLTILLAVLVSIAHFPSPCWFTAEVWECSWSHYWLVYWRLTRRGVGVLTSSLQPPRTCCSGNRCTSSLCSRLRLIACTYTTTRRKGAAVGCTQHLHSDQTVHISKVCQMKWSV